MMPDREKVIKGLEGMIDYFFNIYRNDTDSYKCAKAQEYSDCAIDAIALLKEQEAVEPKTETSAKGYWYTCGVCGWWLFEVRDTVHFDDRKRIHFCASCGQEVKWEWTSER